MTDVHGNQLNTLSFVAINIRNQGSLISDNNRQRRTLKGDTLRVYPGGLLKADNILLDLINVTVDVMGIIEADHDGYNSAGMCSFQAETLPPVTWMGKTCFGRVEIWVDE